MIVITEIWLSTIQNFLFPYLRRVNFSIKGARINLIEKGMDAAEKMLNIVYEGSLA